MSTFRTDLHLGRRVPLTGRHDLANGSITESKIDNGAVTENKLRDGVVMERHLKDGSVSTAKLANGSVTTIKLADGSVTTIKIADGSVTNDKIASGALTRDKFEDGTLEAYFSDLEDAKSAANTAASSATSAASSANAAASNYSADHEQAVSDHSQAVADKEQAASDHSTASSDHNIAVSDHSTASSDHSQAASDHSTAVGDHSQASGDHANVLSAISSAESATGSATQAAASANAAATSANAAASNYTSDHETAVADHTQAVADHNSLVDAQKHHVVVCNMSSCSFDDGEAVKFVVDGTTTTDSSNVLSWIQKGHHIVYKAMINEHLFVFANPVQTGTSIEASLLEVNYMGDEEADPEYEYIKTATLYHNDTRIAFCLLRSAQFTYSEKVKLSGIASGANKVTKTSQLTNDSGYLTSHQDISGKVDKVDGKVLSSNDYTDEEKAEVAKIEGVIANVNELDARGGRKYVSFTCASEKTFVCTLILQRGAKMRYQNASGFGKGLINIYEGETSLASFATTSKEYIFENPYNRDLEVSLYESGGGSSKIASPIISWGTYAIAESKLDKDVYDAFVSNVIGGDYVDLRADWASSSNAPKTILETTIKRGDVITYSHVNHGGDAVLLVYMDNVVIKQYQLTDTFSVTNNKNGDWETSVKIVIQGTDSYSGGILYYRLAYGLYGSLNSKQDKLVTGSGISIADDGKTISASVSDVKVDGVSVVSNGVATITSSSSNDYTTAEKSKLAGIAAGATVGATAEQAAAITDLALKVGNTDVCYMNILNNAIPPCVDNTVISSKTTGATKSDSTWAVTDYILLKANTTYYCYGFYMENFYALYDSDKTFNPDADATITYDSTKYKGTITVGNSDIYIRTSWNKTKTNPYISQYEDKYYAYGTVDYSYKSYKNTENITAIVSKISKLEKNSAPELNLIDQSAVTADTAFSGKNNGATKSSTGWNLTDYILLKANTKYYGFGIYFDSFYCFYNTSKVVLSSPDVTINYSASDKFTGSIAVGSSDVYFRASWLSSKTNPYLSQYIGAYRPYGTADYSFASQYLMKDKSLSGKKVLIIGDSISAYNYGYYNKWTQALVEVGFLPADMNNSSIHATGFVTDGTYAGGTRTGDNFLTRLMSIEETSTYDYVIVFGGVNDYIQGVEWDSFCSAVDNFYTYLIGNFVNASIMVITPLYKSTHGNNSIGKNEDDYINEIKTVASQYHLPILNAHSDSGFYPEVESFKTAWTNQGDGLHPNAEWSSKRLAPFIRAFIEKHLKY